MSAPPPTPVESVRLARDAHGAPWSERYGDVYASRDGAAAQARHVFLGGNRLPGRWHGRASFTIVETGFGLGTNFLATLLAWRADARRCGRLHYVAFERHPLPRDDLRAGLESALHEAAQPLLAQWPLPIAGLHRLHFDAGRVTLTLAFGDAARLAPRLVAAADAFYLDGFTPERNPELWTAPLFKALARLARDDATLATWCTARAVRDALAEAGFACALQPGFGRKRQMLVGERAPRATLRRLPLPAPHDGPRTALVIGAGLAGATSAAALAARGWDVQVLDAGVRAGGASALPWGLLHPQVARDDGPVTRLARAGFVCTRAQLDALGPAPALWRACGVFELAADIDAPAAQRLLQSQGWPPSLLAWRTAAAVAESLGAEPAHHGFWSAQGAVVAPAAWCRRLLDAPGIAVREHAAVAALQRDGDAWCARDASGTTLARAAVAIVAGAYGSAALLGARFLPMQPIAGRVTRLAAAAAPLRAALAGAGTLAVVDGTGWLGATYETDPALELAAERADAANLARLPRLLAAPPRFEVTGGFAGRRCAARDRQPVVGSVVDEAAALGASRHGTQLHDLPRRSGLFASTAFGSRGLLLAPLAAELLAAQLDAEPWPLERDLAALLDPGRFLLRALRTGRAPLRAAPVGHWTGAADGRRG